MSLKGAKEFNKWKQGKPLTRKEAMSAQCYICNGEKESAVDCRGERSCPMYGYALYPSGEVRRPSVSQKTLDSLAKARQRAKEVKTT